MITTFPLPLSGIKTYAALAAAAASLLVPGAGCAKPAPANLGAECAKLGGQKNTRGAIACFKRVLETHPGYADEYLKPLTALTPEDVGMISSLCKVILQEYFAGKIALGLRTEYSVLPTSDKGSAFKAPGGKKLEKPITLPGVIAFDPTSSPEGIRAGIKAALTNEVSVFGGKIYAVIGSLVTVEESDVTPSANGQAVPGEGYYRVTIIPTGVAVYPAPKR